MSTTIRINKNVKQGLKSAKVETNLNKNVTEEIKRDSIPEKSAPTIEEIKKLLDYDCPQGNGLDKISGIIEFDEPTNSVELKKQAYKRS